MQYPVPTNIALWSAFAIHQNISASCMQSTYRSVLRQPSNENIHRDAINRAVRLQIPRTQMLPHSCKGTVHILAIRARSRACLISVVRIHPELPHERMPPLLSKGIKSACQFTQNQSHAAPDLPWHQKSTLTASSTSRSGQ